MESKAIAKFQRVSPRKTRLVARNVQGLGVDEAMNLLRFTPNKPAGVLYGVVKSARQRRPTGRHGRGRHGGEGNRRTRAPPGRRFMPRAQGRATKIRKRTSHITVILAEGQE